MTTTQRFGFGTWGFGVDGNDARLQQTRITQQKNQAAAADQLITGMNDDEC